MGQQLVIDTPPAQIAGWRAVWSFDEDRGVYIHDRTGAEHPCCEGCGAWATRKVRQEFHDDPMHAPPTVAWFDLCSYC